tara:strand:- start:21768 stop:22226 length:459 start_codon:yes stop_codon:yes gene_type:complete
MCDRDEHVEYELLMRELFEPPSERPREVFILSGVMEAAENFATRSDCLRVVFVGVHCTNGHLPDLQNRHGAGMLRIDVGGLNGLNNDDVFAIVYGWQTRVDDIILHGVKNIVIVDGPKLGKYAPCDYLSEWKTYGTWETADTSPRLGYSTRR